MNTVPSLVALVEALRNADTLEDMLYALADAVAGLLEVERVTVRLLDETRARLLTAARAGKPIHGSEVSFAVGEGLIGWVVEKAEILRTDGACQPLHGMREAYRRKAVSRLPCLREPVGKCGSMLVAKANEQAPIKHLVAVGIG